MDGNQPSTQPHSTNPVNTSTHNDGIIVNEPISVQQEQLIVTQETVQPHWFSIVNMNHQILILQEWKHQQTILTITSMHLLAFSKWKGLLLHQPRNNFPWMRICVSVKPQATIPHQGQILHHCTEQKWSTMLFKISMRILKYSLIKGTTAETHHFCSGHFCGIVTRFS